MKNKNLIILIFVLIGLGVLSYLIWSRPKAKTKSFSIGLIYLLKHPAIEQGIDGFKSELQEIEKTTGTKFDVNYANAFGEPKNINGILADFKQKDYDAIVALTTPCAQVAKHLITERPVVFVGVSDPIEAGLVNNLDSGLNNVTGTTSKDPNFETLQLAIKLFPKMKKIGIIFTSSESNSISILENLDRKIKDKNLSIIIIKKAITNTTEILPVTRSLLPDVDAMFIINDNTIVSSVDLVIKESKNSNKPVFASDVESVNKGALFTYGLNYKDEGIAAAEILKKILLDKQKPSQVPVFINDKYYLFVNREIMKYSVDTSLISGAQYTAK